MSARHATSCSAHSGCGSGSRTAKARAGSSLNTPLSLTSTAFSTRWTTSRTSKKGNAMTRMKFLALTAAAYLPLSLLQIASAQQTSPATATSRTLIRAGHVLNVHTGAEPAEQTIVVIGDKISAIAATSATPQQAGDMVVDLSRYTVMPGLMDVHTHLTMDTNFDPYHELITTPVREALIGAANAKKTLDAGFTTVRNVGAGGYSDVALRDAINAGQIVGPHRKVTGA